MWSLLVFWCVDYSCAMQKEILAHGRLYISRQWICFYANIFRWETAVSVTFCTSNALPYVWTMYSVHAILLCVIEINKPQYQSTTTSLYSMICYRWIRGVRRRLSASMITFSCTGSLGFLMILYFCSLWFVVSLVDFAFFVVVTCPCGPVCKTLGRHVQ